MILCGLGILRLNDVTGVIAAAYCVGLFRNAAQSLVGLVHVEAAC